MGVHVFDVVVEDFAVAVEGGDDEGDVSCRGGWRWRDRERNGGRRYRPMAWRVGGAAAVGDGVRAGWGSAVDGRSGEAGGDADGLVVERAGEGEGEIGGASG